MSSPSAVPATRTAPPLPHHPVTWHAWRDVVLAHWRVDAADAARRLPAGVRPDLVDGSAWVCLGAWTFGATTVPPLPRTGRLGDLHEVTVRVPTVDAHDRHGVTYLSLDTQHPAPVPAGRLGIGLPYKWSRVGSRVRDGVVAHRAERRPSAALLGEPTRASGGDGRRLRSRIAVRPGPEVVAPGDLAVELVSRWGVHVRHLGRTRWWRTENEPLPLHDAALVELDDDLVAAAGFAGVADRAPDVLLASPGRDCRYSRG